MSKPIKTGMFVSAQNDTRGVSQAVFVAVTLMIITGGMWSLYMTDAPYHPEVSQSDFGMTIAFQ
jgi:hypothetical protein